MKKLKLFFACLLMAVLSIGQVWADNAAKDAVLFSENFDGYSADAVPSGSVSSETNHRVIFGNGSVTYASANGSGSSAGATKVMNAQQGAEGTLPELMVGKKGSGSGAAGGTFSISGIPSGGAKEITVSYKQNAKALAATITGTGYSTTFTSANAKATTSFDITVADGADATFTLTLQATTTNNVRVDDISITVKTAGTGGGSNNPTYSIEPIVNHEGWGTATLNGSVITAEPADGYRYASPAYTVTEGTATVSQDGDEFTVTPSTNCTVQINFEALPTYTVTLKDDNSTLPQASAGASVTLPSRDGCKGYTFAGWTKTWTAAQSSWTTTAPTIIPAGNYTPQDNENLYPVYTKTEGQEESWSLCSTANDVTEGTYVITWENTYYLPSETTATSNPVVGSGITVANNALSNTVTSAMQWTFTGNNTDGFTVSHTSGNTTYYLGSTDKAQGIVVATSNSSYTWEVSDDGTYGMLLNGAGSRYLAVYNSSTWRYYTTGDNYTGKLRLYKKTGGSTTSYISEPNCCIELGALEQAVVLDQNSATLTWNAIAGVTAWSVTGNIKNGAAITSGIGTITDAANNKKQCVITGLTSSTTYEFQIHATTISSGYCSDVDEWSVEGATEASYTIAEATNNELYGSVSRSGNVITGAPKQYCQYATPAYSVSPENSATVAQDANTFTVTPSANTTVTINFVQIPVTGVTLDQNALALEVGGATATLTATVAPDEANPAVEWSVSPAGVVTVENGVVTAVAGGTAKVRATSTLDNTKYVECDVTVTVPLPTITITQDQLVDFTDAYDDYAWSIGGVQGIVGAYKSGGMQFNSNKAGYYAYNTTAIPGNITKIAMTKASGSTRPWTPYVSNEPMTAVVAGKNLEAKNVEGTVEWEVTGSNQYFYLQVAEGATVISSIVITYEPIYSAVTVDDAIEHGSVAVSGAVDLTAVAAGTVLTLTNDPDDIFQLVDYNVYKTGEPATKITVTDGKFTMPLYDVTVSASFEEEKNLESIAITNPASKLTFWVNETFSAEGVAIKAVYDNTTEKANVTPKSITAPDMTEAGNKTVTIAYEEKGIEKTTSYEIIVKALPTTAEKAATVAEIREIYDLFEDTEGLYVKGTIYKISGFYSNKYITYWITDSYDAEAETEADNHTNEFRLYNCLDFSGASFTAQTDLELGQEVVVNGNLTLVDEIYQFSAGGVIISRPKYVKSIALSGEYTTEFNENAEFSHEGMVVTATYNYGDAANVTTEATWSEPDMTTAGEKTVTVSYTFDGKTVTKDYTITIVHVCASEVAITKGAEDNTKGTYTVVEENVCTEGDGATVAVTDIVPAEGYRFAGVTSIATGGTDEVGTVVITETDTTVTGIKANATIGVNFEEIPSYQVTWSVNGDETLKTTVQEGSKPAFPTPNPTSCDDANGSTAFYGWATEPWTGKAENLNEKTVYTSAADMDPVTAEGTKYYAVFAKATPGDPVPMTLWSEDFSSYNADDVPEGGSPISYSVTNGGGTTKVYTTQLGAGGDSPELLVAKSNGTFTASGIATNGVSSATLTYHTNQTSNLTVTTTAEHVTIGNVSVDGTDIKLCTRTITFAEGAPETFDLTFMMTTGSNSRLDDIVLSAELSSVSYSEFLTTCCTKYDIALADGGTVVVEEVQQGTFSAEFEKACADTEVKLTASPATKYHFDAWSVSYNDGENDQTVTVNETEVENVKVYSFMMPAFDVTVSATFAHDNCVNLAAPTQNGTIEPTYNSATIAWNAVANASSYYVTVTENGETEPFFSANVNNVTSKELEGLTASTTYNFSIMAVGDGTDFCAEGNDSLKGSFITIAAPVYTVKFSTGANNPAQADIAEDVRGEGITIPEGPTPVCEGWAFAGWATAAVETQTTEAPAKLYQKNETYIPNEDNKTLYAVYSTEVASSGNGGSVEITKDTENFPTGYGGANTFTEYTLDGYKFKIQQAYINGGKLQWRANGNNNGTGTNYNTQTYPQKITSVVLAYNASDNNKNFTLNVGATENPTSGAAITPEIDGSTYTFNCAAANADYFVLTNGSGAGYLDAITINYGVASVTNYISEPACCTKYDITIAAGIENGSVTADLAKACEGVEVTLTPIASASYHLESLSVMNGETQVEVTNNKFNMPAGNVTISATFVHDDCTNLDAPTLNEVTKDHHSATIAWNAVEGAVSYVLNVTEHNAAAIVTNENVTETSKALSSLKPSTQYDYSIMAVGDGTDKCADGNALLEGNFTTDEPATTGTFELFTGNLEEGDYVIVYAAQNNAMKASQTANANRMDYADVTPTQNQLVNPDESIIWHIAPISETTYWTIYSDYASKYIGSTTNNNQAKLLGGDVTDAMKWTVSAGEGVYDFINVARQAASGNPYLRNNDNGTNHYGFACYANGTGGALTLYKKVDASKPSTPTFSVAGGDYEEAQTVHIACATEGATIHYTTDGSTPTNESAEFTEDLEISTNTTLQAIAIKGDASSNVATATYTFIVWKSVDEIWNDITADGPTDARVYGYVSETNVNNFANNFYISEDGSKEGNQLYAFRMNMNDKSVAVGDKVKLFGDLTIYNNVKEFKYTSNTNCGQVISVEPKGALQSVAVSGTPTKTVYAANEEFEPAGLVVTGTYENGYVGVITEGITWGNDLTENKVTETTTVHVTATVGVVTSPAYDVAVTVASKTLESIAVAPASYTIYTGEGLPQPAVTATFSEGEPEDVSAFATYDSENVFNTATLGDQTITVSYTFGEETKTTTYTVSVKDYANDAENPYTPEQARYITINAIGSEKAERDIYVQGIVSRANNVSSGKQRYWISIDGETTSTEFDVYNGLYIGGEAFTSGTKLIAGDEVIVKGKVVYYNSATPQFASGESQVVTHARTPNFSIANVTAFEVGTDDKAAVVTKDGNGAVTLASSSDVEVVTIVDNKLHAVAPGTATITANLAANGIYKAASTTFSVEVVAAQAHHILTLKTSGVVYRAIDAFEGTSVWNLLDTVTAPNIAGYNFKGWSLEVAGDVLTSGTAGELEADKTLYAVYTQGEFTYAKVTETAQITDGQYLIVYETGNVAFNGALASLDVASNIINVAIVNEVITGTNSTAAAEFTIDATANTIRSKSGKYIGRTSNSNGMNTSEEATLTNTMSIDADQNFVVKGTGGNIFLMYNSNSGDKRFRYYGGTQKAIQLYKRTDGAESAPVSNPTITVEENEVVNISNVVSQDVPVSIVAENGGTVNIDQPTIASNITATDGATINVNEMTTATSITVDDESKINVTAQTTVNEIFSVAATMGAGKSGQVSGVNKVSLAQSVEAYFDITLGDNANPEHWHAIAVPFPVDAISGVYDAETGLKLTNEVNYAIMDYHGDIRAQGLYGWKKFRGIMQPGVFYLMTVDGNTKTFRFKMSGTTLPTANSLALELYAQTSGNTMDGGWNGVANPTLQHGTVNQTVTVLNPSTYTYEDKDAGEMNFVVGTPFFIQANQDIVDEGMEMGAVDGSKDYYAPKRASEKSIENVKVFFGNDEYKDKLTISANEEALNEYQIGKDLAKMTMTNTPKVAQIFGNAYNAKMCRIYAPMENDQAEYSLTLYAPQAGEYTIAAPSVENADLYLTHEGTIIWNLSMGAYTNDFAKGNTEGYGLLLVKKAPSVATGVESAEANEAGVQKVIIEDKVFILRGGQMYDVTGKAVR